MTFTLIIAYFIVACLIWGYQIETKCIDEWWGLSLVWPVGPPAMLFMWIGTFIPSFCKFANKPIVIIGG